MSENFKGWIDLFYCPKCDGNLQMDWSTHKYEPDSDGYYFHLANCHKCKKGFVFVYKEEEEEDISDVRFQAPAFKTHTQLELVFSYPISEPHVHESVPANITESYKEGVRCLNVNSPNAAALMFRKTLQQVCESKGADKNEKLWKQVQDVVPRELKETAEELREWGNIGGHTDEIVSNVRQTDAKNLKEFIDKLFLAMYEFPYKIGSMKDKRTKTS